MLHIKIIISWNLSSTIILTRQHTRLLFLTTNRQGEVRKNYSSKIIVPTPTAKCHLRSRENCFKRRPRRRVWYFSPICASRKPKTASQNSVFNIIIRALITRWILIMPHRAAIRTEYARVHLWSFLKRVDVLLYWEAIKKIPVGKVKRRRRLVKLHRSYNPTATNSPRHQVGEMGYLCGSCFPKLFFSSIPLLRCILKWQIMDTIILHFIIKTSSFICKIAGRKSETIKDF